tara:strand:- start:630 stop:860 length:231 start_codon:yes stop_codon:yes gene_type:complete
MQNKLRKIISVVLNIPIDNISPISSPENIEKWDSLAQLNLIMAIEEEFGFKLSDDEVIKMTNFESIMKIMRAHVKE